MPGGQSIPQPVTQGRRTDIEPAEPADSPALSVRARLTGCTVEEARDPLAGDDLGRCIRYLHRDERDRRELLTVWQSVSAAWHNYAARCLSLPIAAQGATIPILSDPMQTDQSLRVDLRTSAERDSAARHVWFQTVQAIESLPAPLRSALMRHTQGIGAPVWDADRTRPTRAGALAVRALDTLREK